jgi:type III secretion protein U
MSGEKTEEPTDAKLEKSREKGEVTKSADLTMAVSMLGVVVTLLMTSASALEHLRVLVHLGLDIGPGNMPVNQLFTRIGAMAIEAAWIVVPLLLAAMVFALIGAVAHVGFFITLEPVVPKPEKVDPAAGMKRIFSPKSLLTFGQLLFKALVLGAVLWQVVVGLIPLISGSAYQSAGGIGVIAWSAVTKVLSIGLLLFMVLGPLDFGLQRWLFMKDQRMSKDDIQRENKDQEGDPQLKADRKAMAEEIANEDPRQAVAGANAVIVNPTHFAVAVRYRPEDGGLPTIVAKGVDREALRIRHAAEGLGVPVFTNPPLARALHKLPLHQAIPEELFEAVAAVLRWVDQVAASSAARASGSQVAASAGAALH